MASLLAAAISVTLLAGCSGSPSNSGKGNITSGDGYSSSAGNGNKTGNSGTGGSGNSTSPTSTPTPTPTGTPDPTSTDGGSDGVTGSTIPYAADAISFTKSFATVLTDQSLTTAQWRAAVIPDLYSTSDQQLYSTQDPQSIPFCSAVSKVEIGTVSEEVYDMDVSFVGSTSTMYIEIVENGTNSSGNMQFLVATIDKNMTDNGGC